MDGLRDLSQFAEKFSVIICLFSVHSSWYLEVSGALCWNVVPAVYGMVLEHGSERVTVRNRMIG